MSNGNFPQFYLKQIYIVSGENFYASNQQMKLELIGYIKGVASEVMRQT